MPFLPPNQQHQSTEVVIKRICYVMSCIQALSRFGHSLTAASVTFCSWLYHTSITEVLHQLSNTVHLTALCPGLPGWVGTRKVKPTWILLKQETVSGSGIHWAICKSAPRSRQITMPVPHHSKFFTGRMPFLPPNQQCQSTEGRKAIFTPSNKR